MAIILNALLKKSYMKNIHKYILIFLAVCLIHETAFAVYPVSSRHAETLGQHSKSMRFHYSVEYEEIKADSSIQRTHEFDFILSYGLFDDLDIIFELPYQHIRYSNKKTYDGLDDISLELKWRFFKKNNLSFSLYPQVTFPTGGYKKDVGEGKATYAASVLMSDSIGRLSYYLSGKYTRNENRVGDRLDLWAVNFTSFLKVMDKVEVMGSVDYERDTDKTNKKYPLSLSGGIKYSLNDRMSIMPTFTSTFYNTDNKDYLFFIGTFFKF